MKKIISFSWVNAMLGLALCSFLFAFANLPGAHSVQVYLDNKMVIDQYIGHKTGAPKLTLDNAKKYNQLIVKYNECGRTVSGRKITIKDSNDKVLKDWRFEGSSTGFDKPMECSMKEIVSLKQKGSNTLKLFYSSADFPEGQEFASLVFSGDETTASK
jgi:hypothetical protein